MNPIIAARNFGKTVTAWLGEGGKPVSREIAQSRSNICLVCPKNEKWMVWELLTKPAANLLKSQIQLKSVMQLKVQGEDGLHTCSVCGCYLQTLVWAPNQRIAEMLNNGDAYPDHCWKPKCK